MSNKKISYKRFSNTEKLGAVVMDTLFTKKNPPSLSVGLMVLQDLYNVDTAQTNRLILHES